MNTVQAAKKKKCQDLGPWAPAIRNHFWFVCRKCEGDAGLLRVSVSSNGVNNIIQDTKTFSKCYVGRNGKQNQQKLRIQVCGSLKTQRNQGCQG